MASPSETEAIHAALIQAGRAWGRLDPSERCKAFETLRRQLFTQADAVAQQLASLKGCSLTEALTTEVLPLLDACRFLADKGPGILASRRHGADGRPFWLMDVELLQEWRPRGLVLIVCPGNFPLFLPMVQALQALAAGNAVVLKPAPRTAPLLSSVLDLLFTSGVDAQLVHLADEGVSAVYEWLERGPDLIVFTGSSSHGRQLLQAAALKGIPMIAELSGCDSFWVLEDADVRLAAQALAFGLALNQGRMCITPRRVFVFDPHKEAFLEALLKDLSEWKIPVPNDPVACDSLGRIRTDAETRGAKVIGDTVPLILDGISTDSLLWQSDVFFPVLGVRSFTERKTALIEEHRCPFRLGASIFTENPSDGEAFGAEIGAPVTVINDTVAPTADPRVAFGGRKASGYGMTRGAEGLRAMAVQTQTLTRKGHFRPQYEPSKAAELPVIQALVALSHGTLLEKANALYKAVRKAKR